MSEDDRIESQLNAPAEDAFQWSAEDRELDREMWELEHEQAWEALFRPDDGP